MTAIRQKGCVIWTTGLPGAGKSTISIALQENLQQSGLTCIRLDGDQLRSTVNSDLGFSRADRKENVRRTAELAKLLMSHGIIVVVALISPFESDREMARGIIGPERFFEVFVDCSPTICEQRDVKGLYKKAREGTIPEFTGVSSPYEPPRNPALRITTDNTPVGECVGQLMEFLRRRHIV